MKRITSDQIIRQKRLLHIRAKRNNRKKQRRESGSPSYSRVKAPETFNLKDQKARSNLLNFINQIKQKHLERKNILIDFSATKQMSADGTLLFKAELCRLAKYLSSGQTYQCKLPHHNRIKQVLQQTEILQLLNYKGKVSTTLQEVIHWHTANGSNTDGSQYEPVLGNYEGQVEEELLTGLYVGLTEAMTNTTQHAYLETRNDLLKVGSKEEGWWMFSQKKDGKLSILFCDLGIGIPRSLPKKRPNLLKIMKELRINSQDHEYIKAAIDDSLSRTEQPYRGKGLGQMVRILKNIPESSMLIYSNKGYYQAKPNDQIYAVDYKDSIMGTLICWSINL